MLVLVVSLEFVFEIYFDVIDVGWRIENFDFDILIGREVSGFIRWVISVRGKGIIVEYNVGEWLREYVCDRRCKIVF